MNSSKAYLITPGGGGGGESQGVAVFKDYGANVAFNTALGLQPMIPAPPVGKVRMWSSELNLGLEGSMAFRGQAASPVAFVGSFDVQIKLAGFNVGAPILGGNAIAWPVSNLVQAPGEAFEADVSAFGGGASGISWSMFWRDYAGFVAARVVPLFGSSTPLVPAPAASRVRVVGHPGINWFGPGLPSAVQFHNRDTVPHTYKVQLFYPGVSFPQFNSGFAGPYVANEMGELFLVSTVLGEGAFISVEQGEPTVTTPSMFFACYQDLPLTP